MISGAVSCVNKVQLVMNGAGPDGCLPELDMFPPVVSYVFMVYVLLC